jgi:hypothetical protein
MPFDSYQQVRQEFITHWGETQTADNKAAAYDIVITQPSVEDNQKYWACIGAYHLTAEENNGKHVLYLEALDENNNRIFGTAFKWGWEGQRPDESSPDLIDDKPPNELVNLVIWANQILWTGVRDAIPSGEVKNVRSTHPDEAPGNTWGHHSFYVAFKRVEGDDGGTEPPEPPPELECGEIRKLTESALKRIENAESELAAAKKDLNSILDICKEEDQI